MRKILTLLLASAAVQTFAVEVENEAETSSNKYSSFQEFDREYNLGYGVTSGNLTNGTTGAVNNSQFLNYIFRIVSSFFIINKVQTTT